MNNRFLPLLVLLSLILSAMQAGASTYWLSHCAGKIADKASPVIDGSATVKVATLFGTEDLSALKGSEIAKVRFGIVSKLKLDGVQVWIAESLDAAPLWSARVEKGGLKSGWNEVSLDTPVPVTGTPLYLGYTFSQPVKSNVISVVESAGGFPLMIDAGDGWRDISTDYPGALSVELGIEGESVVKSDLTILSLKPEYEIVEENSMAFLKVEFVNSGTEPISRLSYTVNNGRASYPGSVSFPETAPRANGCFYIKVPMQTPYGETEIALNVVSLQDEPLRTVREAQTTVMVAEVPLLRRNLLLEEFSNEMCNNCPSAAVRIHNVINNLPDPGRVSIAVHHAGSSYDSFTIPESKEYESAFYSNSKYSPMAMYDRTPFDGTVNTNPYSEDVIQRNMDAALSVSAGSSLSITPFIDKEKGIVEVEAYGTADSEREMALTLFLTESGVPSIRQYGASAGYLHDNMLRAVGPVWGDAIELDGNLKFSRKSRLEYDNSWNPDSCRIIAFLTDADPESSFYRRVLQSISLPLAYAEEKSIGSGVASLQGSGQDIRIKVVNGNLMINGEYVRADVFDYSGSNIATTSLCRGIYIVRVYLADGSVVTKKITV